MNQVMVPVSVGELVDKITILKIKEKNIADENKLANVKTELAALEKVCMEMDINLEDQLVDDLLKINSTLWKIEDDIRQKEAEKAFDEVFVKLARSVYITNDQRFEIKSKINELYGSALREEKSYESY